MNEEVIKKARQQVGLVIRKARKDKGLTQEEVATQMGITTATINKIEVGKFNYGIDFFFKLSIILDFRFDIQLNVSSDIKGRFDVFEKGNEATVLDYSSGIRIVFQKGKFNTTQQVYFEQNKGGIAPEELSTALKEIAEWLNENHSDLL